MADFLEIINKHKDAEGNVPSSAIEALDKAISKAVGDGFVTKDRYRAKLDEIGELNDKLGAAEDTVATVEAWKKKHADLETKFENYKANIASKEARAHKVSLVKAALIEANADPDAVELLLNGVDLDAVELAGDGLKDGAAVVTPLKEKHGKYFGEPFERGVPSINPPAGGARGMTREALEALPLGKQVEYANAHPEEYRRLYT